MDINQSIQKMLSDASVGADLTRARFIAGEVSRDQFFFAVAELVILSGIVAYDPVETSDIRFQITQKTVDIHTTYPGETMYQVMEYAVESVYNS